MNIVAKTIELLMLSYSDDLMTAFNAECEIFENFGKMTKAESKQYRIEAKKISEDYEANKLAEAYKKQLQYENSWK